MKPEPIFPPAPALTDTQRLILRASGLPKGGPYPLGLRGAGEFRAARALVEMGMGSLDGKQFTANARGVAAVAE